MMMIYRHLEELDLAVRVASHAVCAGRVQGEERLARHLYQHWYAGSAAGVAPSLPTRTWQAWSPHWSDAMSDRGADLVRLYLSCKEENAARVVGLVTATAMSWHEPWRFTSVTASGGVSRPDSTVLYLPIDSLGRLRSDVQTLLTRLRPLLGVRTPAFTLRVAPGAAFAQNPGDGRSFGEHRCGLVARAVASSKGLPHREQVTRATYAFADEGVDPERPYRENCRGTWDQAWRSY